MTALATRTDVALPGSYQCVVCGSRGRDVALTARNGALVALCRKDARPPAEQIRRDLAAMWPQLAEEWWRGDATDDQVFATLTQHRPDISPHLRWELWNGVEAAVALRRHVDEGHYAPRDLGMDTEKQLDDHVCTRINDAVTALIGGAR